MHTKHEKRWREKREESGLLQIRAEADTPSSRDLAENSENFKNSKITSAFLGGGEGILVKA